MTPWFSEHPDYPRPFPGKDSHGFGGFRSTEECRHLHGRVLTDQIGQSVIVSDGQDSNVCRGVNVHMPAVVELLNRNALLTTQFISIDATLRALSQAFAE